FYFFFSSRLSPLYTLFPYTTLFRSRRRPSERASLEHLADHVPRPPPHFLIDPSHVLADQPQRQDLQAGEEEQDREQGEHAFDLRPEQEATQAEEEREAEAHQGHDDSD